MSTSARSNDLLEDNTCKKIIIKIVKSIHNCLFWTDRNMHDPFSKNRPDFFALNMGSGYIWHSERSCEDETPFVYTQPFE